MTRRWALVVGLCVAAAGSRFLADEGPPERSPAAFEVSRYNDAKVEVDLRGGPVEFEGGKDFGENTGKPTTGSVHGRVVDRQGNPVAGAVVLAAPQLQVLGDALLADDGVQTDEDGRFTLKTYAEAVSVVAMDHALGMSRAPRADVGDEVELVLHPFTWIEGFVRDGDGAVEGRVFVTSSGDDVFYYGDADASGHYMIGPLPPGAYQVRARNDETDQVIAFPVGTVELEPGTTTTHSLIESGSGALWVEFLRPDALANVTVGVALFGGDVRVGSDAEYHAALRGDLGSEVFGSTSLGIDHPRKLFRGLPFGTYTACARLYLGDDVFVTCQGVEVEGSEATEVDLRLRTG